MKLKDKIAVITGGSRGMGRATALLFAKEEAKVVIAYKENDQKANEVINEIKKKGGQSIAVQADITKAEDVKKIFAETIKTFGTIDILVTYAGINKTEHKDFLELDTNDWQSMLGTNLVGTFLCCQTAAKTMLEKKQGKIITISSIRGLDNYGGTTLHYGASKAGVINLTKSLAKLVAPNINVNCIVPGFTETDMAKTWDKKLRESAMKDAFLKRLVQPEEIAQSALFLASDASNAITGEVLIVDAGYQLK